MHPVWMIPRIPDITGLKPGGIPVAAASLAAGDKARLLGRLGSECVIVVAN